MPLEHGSAMSKQAYKDLSDWGVFLPAFRNRDLLGSVLPPRSRRTPNHPRPITADRGNPLSR